MRITILKITALSAAKESKDGRNYKTVTFHQMLQNGNKLMPTTMTRAINVWETGPMESKGDALYPFLAKGLEVPGTICQEKTEEYIIGEGDNARTVDYATEVIFYGENKERVFSKNGHTLASDASSEEASAVANVLDANMTD